MDDEILKTIHSHLGKDVNIIDCQKITSVQEEETLLVNGVPIRLDSLNGDVNAIKAALQNGQIPSMDVFNQMLLQAGIQQQPIQLETSVSVKSVVTTNEEISISRNGKTLENHRTETKENYLYESKQQESVQPFIEKTISKNKEKECTNLKPSCSSNKNVIKDETRAINLNHLSHPTNDNRIKVCYTEPNLSHSYSNISDYSTCASIASASSSIDLENNDSAIGDIQETYTLSDHSKKSSTSCDSGHDGEINISDLEFETNKLDISNRN